MNDIELVSANKSFGGWMKRYRHRSQVLHCDMVFGIYLPPQADQGKPLPVLYWLSGLTCTDENFMQKAGAQRLAAELGMVVVAPDTSPRGEGVPDDAEGAYDFGLGAGFYGHGALICALKNPGRYRSVSAFAPISNPSDCPWGHKALGQYLGNDRAAWKAWDTCELLAGATERLPLLVDQGESDNFLAEQLKPEALEAAAAAAGHPLTLRRQPGYDHSYYFIASFIDDHLRHHAAALGL